METMRDSGYTMLKALALAWAPFVIRITLGAIFIMHGSQKLFGAFNGAGMKGTTDFIESLGFKPAVLWAWLLTLTEFVGGLGLIFGLLTRVAALGIVVIMVVAIARVHFNHGFFLPEGFEYSLALLAMALSLVLSGAGKLSLDWWIRHIWQGKA